MESTCMDLCNMSTEDCRMLDKISLELGEEYTKFIDLLSEKYGKNIYWWATNIACRNFLLSESYKDICKIITCIRNVENNDKITTIKVPKKCMAQVLRRYYKDSNTRIEIQVEGKQQKSEYLKKTFYYFLWVFYGYKRKKKIDFEIKGKNRDFIKESGIYIDTYILPSCYENGKYKARDFVNIENYTDEKINFLVDLRVNTGIEEDELINLTCNEKGYSLVFKEEFLKLTDYIKCIFYPFYLLYVIQSKKIFRGMDVSEIIKDDLVKHINSRNSMVSILNYAVIKRMKQKKINIKTLISWYEGQASSLGLFKAFNELYPKSRSVGYIGIPIDKKWICLYPSKEQRKQKVVPQEFSVIAEMFQEAPKRFDAETKTFVAPSFRLQYLYNQDKIYQEEKRIVVVLPGHIGSAKNICSYLKKCETYISENNYTIFIKNHPIFNKMRLNDYGQQSYEFPYHFVDGSLKEYITKETIVVTSTSTSSYEMAVMGIPTIIISEENNITFDYLPEGWKESDCVIVYNKDELLEYIDKFSAKDYIVTQLKEYNLAKAGKENVERLLKG